MNGKSYNSETKAAVMAALLTGQSVSAIAKEYKIPKGTVSGWKAQILGVVTEGTQKKDFADRIGEYLLSYLSANLETLKKQAELFSTEGWLMKQNAADVAVLHGVLADKAVRLLEAITREETESSETE